MLAGVGLRRAESTASLRDFFTLTFTALRLLSTRTFLIADLIIGILIKKLRFQYSAIVGHSIPSYNRACNMRDFWKNGTGILFRRQTNILSAAFVLMVAIGASSLLGIFRDRLLYARFYSCCGEQLDAYLAAFRIPDMIFQLVVIGAISSAFIPVFSSLLEKNKKEAHLVASSFMNIVILVFFSLSVVVFIFAKDISGAITASFTENQIDLMSGLTRLMLGAQFFFLLSNFMTAVIQTHQRFLLPALSPLIYNLSIIGGIYFLSGSWGVYGPAIGVVIGAFLHFIIQIPLSLKLGFRYVPTIDHRLKGVRTMSKLMLPRTLSLAVTQVELTVSLFLSTSLPAGSLAIFNLAQNLMSLPVRLVGTTIGQATLPTLARDFSKKELPEFKEIFTTSLLQLMYLALPASGILLVLRVPVVRIAFGAKTFPWEATLLTGRVLAFFFFAIFAQAATQLLIRAFYAIHNTKTPFLIGFLTVVVNVFLSIFLTFNLGWGVLGLAAANSVASLAQAVLLLIFLDRQLGHFDRRALFGPLLKITFASSLMAIFLWLPMRLLDRFVLDTTRTADLVLLTATATLSGTAVYILLSYFLKIKELESYLGLAQRVGKWRDILSESHEVIEPTSSSTSTQ
jgi:putative peptidoglycan lipid II flippase